MIRTALFVALLALSAQAAPTWTSQLQKATESELATMTQLASTTWTLQLSNTWPTATTDNGESTFNTAVWNSANHIVKRLCSSCSSDYQEMYYKRLTDTSSFDVYDSLKENWFSADNTLGTDFCIYSSYDNAVAGSNCWASCNYDDPGIGFPRDCGVSGAVGSQWNSWTHGGKEVAYYTEAASTTAPTIAPTLTPTNTPTPSPTLTPTETPTTKPPSPSPSHTPTEHPTAVPTLTPTDVPTVSPTAEVSNCHCTGCHDHYATNDHVPSSHELCHEQCVGDSSCKFALYNTGTTKCYLYNAAQKASISYTADSTASAYSCYDKA